MRRQPISALILALSATSGLHAQRLIEVENFQLDPGTEIRIEYRDTGVGGTRYTLLQSSDILNWSEAPNSTPVSVIGSGLFGIGAPHDPAVDKLFYSVQAERVPATLGFKLRDIDVDEGSGQQNIIVDFVDENGAPLIYNGPVKYRWSGAVSLVSQLTGEVDAAGTEVAIPLFVEDNAGTETLRQVQLSLIVGEETGYTVDPANSVSTVTIDENDNWWRGSFRTGSESMDLEIFIRQDPSGLLVFLTEGTELVPAGGFSVATSKTFAEGTFQATFPPVVIHPTDGNLVSPDTQFDLELAGQITAKNTIEGTGAMRVSNPSKPYLESIVPGSFILVKDPALQPTDDLTLE